MGFKDGFKKFVAGVCILAAITGCFVGCNKDNPIQGNNPPTPSYEIVQCVDNLDDSYNLLCDKFQVAYQDYDDLKDADWDNTQILSVKEDNSLEPIRTFPV